MWKLGKHFTRTRKDLESFLYGKFSVLKYNVLRKRKEKVKIKNLSNRLTDSSCLDYQINAFILEE